MLSFMKRLTMEKSATAPSKVPPPESKIDSTIANVFKSNASCVGKNCSLTQKDMTDKLFKDAPIVGQLLYNYMVTGGTNEIDLKTFQTVTQQILANGADIRLVDAYFSIFANGKTEMSDADVTSMLYTCHFVDWLLLGVSVASTKAEKQDSVLEAVSRSMFGRGETTLNKAKLTKWCGSNCSKLFTGLHSYVCTRLSEEQGATSGGGVLPKSSSDKSLLHLCKEGHSYATLSTLWLLSCSLPNVYFPAVTTDASVATSNLLRIVHEHGWPVIYNSGSQGLSANRFQHHVLDYRGCSLMLIAFDQFIYIAAIDGAWTQSSKPWGGAQSSVIQLKPDFRIVLTGANQMYFNLVDRTSLQGLQIGQGKSTLLNVNGDFEKVSHQGTQSSLKAIEVWGAGGQSALDSQTKQKAWEAKDIGKQQNRKLVTEDWKNNPDREILEMGGVAATRSQHLDE